MPVQIRPARFEDAAHLAGLITQLGYPTAAAEMEERLRLILAHPEYQTFVSESEGEVNGMIGLNLLLAYEHNGSAGRIAALVVDQACRGKGIGAALVEAGENWLRERGAQAVMLTSRHQRVDAHRFYQRLGYEPTGLRLVKVFIPKAETG